ncbi:hypothetical protein SA2016_0939 [Sinomonas atrocyanea]|uniref:Uncharacterized protein n=1 Tax=Sinomonas atrocyanea TaxID=37927 RepID=A0A126ZYZ9_9MICC|nr:hypothetical protein [Sinomonas atrocyanea]AMM31625.1 hypothetical protein SA2016_0939 [Sinomonas atrocyanea]GEB64226.1 hypothetical protein SAT01_16740 [Sinomonas atrocyanea]GGG57393.1 hypothetical protein GCM10007172_05340 [Sinomonas atrocyanea]
MGDKAGKRLGRLILAAAAAAIIGLAATMAALSSRPQLADRTSQPTPTLSAAVSPAATSSSPAPTLDTGVLQTHSRAAAGASPATPDLPIGTAAPVTMPPAPVPAPHQPRPLPGPAWTRPACPTGKITARVDRVDATVDPLWDPSYTVVVHGSVTNGTTAPVRVHTVSLPDVRALDKEGRDRYEDTLGDCTQSAVPGKPRADELVIALGASLNCSERHLAPDELEVIQYWYTDTACPSVALAYFADSDLSTYCEVGRDDNGGGRSSQNPYR